MGNRDYLISQRRDSRNMEKKTKQSIRLDSVQTGLWVRISTLPQGTMHAQFVRLGLHEGERVKCFERLPGGTVVLQKNRQQVAVGHQLAKQILVYVIEGKDF